MKILGWAVCLCLLPGLAFAGLSKAERRSQFEKALGSIMAAATPQVQESLRDTLIRDYANAKPNKGQAVQVGSGYYFRSAEHEDYAVTGDRTLEACQLRYANPCALLAINDEITSEGELISKDMPRLHYAGQFDLSKIPIIRAVTRNRSDVQSYFALGEPKAMTIHPWGFLFISTGRDIHEAEETALAKCNADPRRKSRDGPCFLYAIDNNVVLPERRTSAKH
jgi:hypothetical protein